MRYLILLLLIVSACSTQTTFEDACDNEVYCIDSQAKLCLLTKGEIQNLCKPTGECYAHTCTCPDTWDPKQGCI